MRDPPTSAELRDAVDWAASLGLPIEHFVIATTARRSKALQHAVFELNLANRAENIFTVDVLCWEDLEELLDEYHDVLTGFESNPKRQALAKASSRFQPEPRWPYLPAAEEGDEIAREIEEASRLIDQCHHQLGRLKLMQLREHRWEQQGADQRLSVLANLARGSLKEGEIRNASRLFIAGRAAVNLMREAGRPNEALGYAYELLRRNPADPEAHRALLSALGPFGPMPTVPDFETAQIGCAVCFVDQESGAETWAILEDAPDADESANEPMADAVTLAAEMLVNLYAGVYLRSTGPP